MTEKVKRKLNGAASKMLATITGRTIQQEARNPTINAVMKARDRRWSWLGHVLRMPETPGAPSPVKLRRTYTRDAVRRRTNYKYRERYKKCPRIDSYGVAIGPHCVANLYKGELQ